MTRFAGAVLAGTLLAAAAMTLAGCGGDDESDSGSASSADATVPTTGDLNTMPDRSVAPTTQSWVDRARAEGISVTNPEVQTAYFRDVCVEMDNGAGPLRALLQVLPRQEKLDEVEDAANTSEQADRRSVLAVEDLCPQHLETFSAFFAGN